MPESFDRVVRAAARRGREAGVCPDADVLAAYLDNGLTSNERSAVEQHCADCVRCQQHLGLLGAVSLDAEPPEIEAARSWLGRWGWLVPVATAVLLVAVWTRTPEQPALPASAPAPASTPAPADAALSADAKVETAVPQAAAPPGGSAPQGFSQPQAPQTANRARHDVAAKAAPSALPASPAPPATFAAEADRIGPVADAARAAAEPASKETDAAGARQEARLLRKAAGPALVATSSTEGYRATGGRIERSTDGGSTWQEVFSDATLTFTASACTPGTHCWFGTASGEVLRTSGDRFVRSKLPEALPVGLITPGSGLEATVTAGSRRYRTTDGITWVALTQ